MRDKLFGVDIVTPEWMSEDRIAIMPNNIKIDFDLSDIKKQLEKLSADTFYKSFKAVMQAEAEVIQDEAKAAQPVTNLNVDEFEKAMKAVYDPDRFSFSPTSAGRLAHKIAIGLGIGVDDAEHVVACLKMKQPVISRLGIQWVEDPNTEHVEVWRAMPGGYVNKMRISMLTMEAIELSKHEYEQKSATRNRATKESEIIVPQERQITLPEE